MTGNENPILTLHHLHENTVTNDFVTRDRILNELTTVQRELVALCELEVERLQENTRVRVEQTQSHVRHIIWELSVEIVPSPSFSNHSIFVLEILTEVVLQLRVIKRIPLRLSANETITLGEVLSKTHTETTGERQTTKVCVLRRGTRS